MRQCLYHTPCARCSRPDVSGCGDKSALCAGASNGKAGVELERSDYRAVMDNCCRSTHMPEASTSSGNMFIATEQVYNVDKFWMNC